MQVNNDIKLEGITLRQFLTSLRSLGFQGTITFEL